MAATSADRRSMASARTCSTFGEWVREGDEDSVEDIDIWSTEIDVGESWNAAVAYDPRSSDEDALWSGGMFFVALIQGDWSGTCSRRSMWPESSYEVDLQTQSEAPSDAYVDVYHELIDWRAVNREQMERSVAMTVHEDGSPILNGTDFGALRRVFQPEDADEEPLD